MDVSKGRTASNLQGFERWMSMIEIKKISKRFDEKVLFQDFDLLIEDGEFVIFEGESGAGKTTLLNMIGTLEQVDQGEIVITGRDISKRKNQEYLLKNEIGFLFQNFALIDSKTVRQNMELVKKSIRSEYSIEKCLELVGLAKEIDTKVYKLSGGEQQRIALARLLFKKCSIILADEPTGSLDEKNAQKVIELLKKCQEMGKTIIMVTHVEAYKNIGSKSVVIQR